MSLRIGVDVGGTKAEAVALDAAGAVTARAQRPTVPGPDGVVASVLGAIGDLGVAGIAAAGIGIPGQIVGSRVRNAVNLGLDELDLGAALGAALGVPVHLENDVNAAALGAHALRGGAESMAYLNFGTGVAAGLVLDGSVWPGSGGTAGEVGHVSIDPAGPECTCGQRGCIETLSGGAAVARRWGRGGVLPVRDVFDAAEAGDPLAAELRAGVARGVAAAVRVLVLAADPAAIVIGGGLSRLGSRLLDDARAELQASSAHSAFLRSLKLDERIELLPADASAGPLGAALSAPATREVAVHG